MTKIKSKPSPVASPSAEAQLTAGRVMRRDRKSQRTRRELAEAATRLFAAKGFAATTVEEITEAADYSTSTFFRQFADKEEVVFYDFAERLEELKSSFAAPHVGVWETIIEAFMHFAQLWDREGELGRQRAQLFYSEPALKFRYLAKNDEWENVIAQLAAAELGRGAEVELTSHLIAGTAVAAFRAGWRSHLTGENTALEDSVRHAFSQLEHLGRYFPSKSLHRARAES